MAAIPASAEGLLRGLTFLTISWVTFTIGTVLVSLRTYVRSSNRAMGRDDYLILVALIIAFFGSITNVYQVANGLGRHIDSLTPEERSGFVKWTLIAEVQIVTGTAFTKASVCFFILRIFKRTNQKLAYIIYGLVTLVTVTTIALVITYLLQCRPLNALYDPRVVGTCYSAHVTFGVAYGQGAVSIFTDFFCAGLPFFVIRKLQMKKRLKIGISLIMGLGVFTASCSIFRTAFLYLNFKEDVTHANTVNVMFAMLEENLGIIVASVATILPLFQQFQPKARIHSSATDDTFALKRNVTKVKTTNHGTASSLEEGLLPLHPTAITKTTAFKIDRAGNSNLRPETGVGFDESWRPSV